MKINPLTPQKLNQNDSTPKNVAFTNGADIALRALEMSPAWGAVTVDLTSMVIPRTAVDFTRGGAAGVETLRRESSSTINHALLGVYGLLASAMLAPAFNKAFGVKGNKIFANNNALDILSQNWANQIKSAEANPLKTYLSVVADNMSGYSDGKWVKLDKTAQQTFVDTMYEQIKNNSGNLSKDKKAFLKSTVTYSTGAESRFKLEGFGKASKTSLDTMLDDIFSVSKTFMSEKVKKAFGEATNIDANTFVKALKKLNLKRSMIGVGLATAIGMSIQPLNRYLTKKKTGKSGFVGTTNRSEDKSTGFAALKLGTAAAFISGVKAVVGGKLKDIPQKIQFHGLVPTMKQFQVLYGLTIMSRLLAARDKDELRESFIKDSLGFLNWLVLGNFVSKLVAKGLDKTLINYSEAEDGKGFWNKLTKSSVKTRDEVINTALKKAGISNVKDGKALKFKELAKLIPDKATKTKLKYLNIAQLAGYLYSGLVLGFAIPKINIAMSKNSEKKRNVKYQSQVFGASNTAFLQSQNKSVNLK